MKFLANENVAGDAVIALREKGHDVACCSLSPSILLPLL